MGFDKFGFAGYGESLYRSTIRVKNESRIGEELRPNLGEILETLDTRTDIFIYC